MQMFYRFLVLVYMATALLRNVKSWQRWFDYCQFCELLIDTEDVYYSVDLLDSRFIVIVYVFGGPVKSCKFQCIKNIFGVHLLVYDWGELLCWSMVLIKY